MNEVLKNLVLRVVCPSLPNIKCMVNSEIALYFTVILSAGVEWAGWTGLEKTMRLSEKNLSVSFQSFSQGTVIIVCILKIPIYCLYNSTSLFIFRVS